MRLPITSIRLLMCLQLPAASVQADSVVVFNEIMYHPVAVSNQAEAAAEWVELVNQMAVDVDVSGWSLDGGIRYVFPQGTILSAGGYRVVTATPLSIPGALGPWTGKLDNGGERIELRNNSGRVMDEVAYGMDGDWPAAPAGGGASLARRSLRTAGASAASWRASRTAGGTPGAENFAAFLPPVVTVPVPLDASWKFHASGADPGSAWKDDAFDDSAWGTGSAGFQLGSAVLPGGVTAATALPAGPVTYYFRKAFPWTGSLTNTTLTLQLCVDDGAAAWLNGVELVRTNLPSGALTNATPAAGARRSAPVLQDFAVPSFSLHSGTNVLAVEVHQAAGLAQGSAMLFYTPGTAPAQARLDGPYTVGSRVRVGATAQQLTHLGVQDADAALDVNDPDGTDGLTGYADDDGFLNGAAGIQVGIWNGAGTLQASATVVSTDPHYAGWRYKAVTPVTLAANTDYYIGARVGIGLEWFLDTSSGTPPFAAEDGFSLTLNTYASGAFARPATDGTLTVGRWGVGNALLGAPAVFTLAADTTDAVFAAGLTASESLPLPANSPVVLNEVSLTGVEIMNTGSSPADLTGMTLRIVNASGTSDAPLPAQPLAGGGFLTLPQSLSDGSRLLLMDGLTVLDSAVVKLNARARFPNGTGPWLRPSGETAGAANTVTLRNEIVINEIMYDHPSATLLPPGAPQPGQWIELYNKSTAEVDVGGWRMDRGIRYDFAPGTFIPAGGFIVLAENPPAFLAAHAVPPAQVFGPWGGGLSHGEDLLVLEDAAGNPADEVHYFSDGRWPSAANAGGSSLELRDVRSDNNAAESWAASDESTKVAWQTFTWRAVNTPAVIGSPTLWKEFNLLLVDGPGECLVDDVRVTDTTNSANLITNGDFSAGAAGWRLMGNHRTSAVQPEPGNAGNSVLRLVASGAGEYQGNQIEATYTGNQALVANREYEISLRARWLSGGGRLNVRQYFDRLPRTHILAVVANGGTPGAANLRAVPNAGPSMQNLLHSPAMPAPGQAVTVGVEASDPDGIASLDLKYSVNGGPWQTAVMTSTNGRLYSGAIPGQTAGTVQFYVEGRDIPGAVRYSPARGPQSRALYAVQDGRGSGPLQKLRLVMTPAEATYMHTPVNTLSNEELGATLIVNDSDIYYDIGVRLKGSFVGRNVTRVGFNLRFQSDHLFRGVHEKVAVDRSQHAASGAVGEIIAKHIASAAGGIPNMYDDLAQFVHPSTTYSSLCHLRLAGFDKEYLDTQYPNGGNGTMFELEGFRWNLNTVDGNPTSPKLPGNESGGTSYLNIDLGNYGTDKEAYRWFMLQSMDRDRDDYSRVIPFCQMFALAGAAFDAEARQRLDFEAFLRTMAYQSLVGPSDSIYTGGAHHNCRFYFRPNDGRALFMPWDWDSSWQRSATAALIGTGNLSKVVTSSPDATRRYYCHLYDLIQTTYNTTYMTRWTQHYGAVSGQDFTSVLNYIGTRASNVLSQLPTTTAFAASAGVPNANGAVTLTGTANIQVAFIEVNGLAYSPVWTSTTAWSITVPLVSGPNTLTVRGLNKYGLTVAAAPSPLQVTNPNASGWPGLRINEWMAENDGAAPDPADGDSEDWFEIHNPTAQPVSLAGWKLSDIPANPALFTVPAGWTIPANGYLLVWADNEPAQNPAAPGAASHLHVSFKLDNDGETLLLSAPDNREIDRVDFATQTANDPEGRYPDGAPGSSLLTAASPGSPNVLTRISAIDLLSATPQFEITATPGWNYQMESSIDLATWLPWAAPVAAAGPTATIPAAPAGPLRFYRVRPVR